MKKYKSRRDLPHTTKSKYHNETRSIMMNQNLKMKQDLNFEIDSKSEKTKGLLHLHFSPPGRHRCHWCSSVLLSHHQRRREWENSRGERLRESEWQFDRGFDFEVSRAWPWRDLFYKEDEEKLSVGPFEIHSHTILQVCHNIIHPSNCLPQIQEELNPYLFTYSSPLKSLKNKRKFSWWGLPRFLSNTTNVI